MTVNLRKKKRAMVLLGIVWGGLLVAFLLFANSVAPPAGNTGGFGEPTCAQAGCHVGTAVNGVPGGSVTISAPSSYTSGATYPIHVIVTDPTARRWGFELSARTLNGQQAGMLIAGNDGNSQLLSPINGIQYVGHTLQGSRGGVTGSVSFDFPWQAPDVSAGPIIFHAAGDGANNDFNTTGDHIYTTSITVQPASDSTPSSTYYFPHLALGGGWQTTLTYTNYSPQTVSCATTFYSDSGGPLSVSFGGTAASSRTDTLAPGAVLHTESTADLNAAEVRGWAKAQCSGPIKASLLFRFYQQGKPIGEAGVNAMTELATKFVTFSDQTTGVAYANPSTQPASVTFSAFNSDGVKLTSKSLTLLAGAHDAANVGPFLGVSSSFRGSIQIESTVPIASLSLNAEAFPSFSSLPPGELGTSIQPPPAAYYFPHLALGAGWQTTLTYINFSPQTVTCTTTFLSDSGSPLSVSFGGAAASSRTDTLAAGGVLHEESKADLNAPEVRGWAKAQCNGRIKASLLFRFYQQGKPIGEAGVNAMTTTATKFVTFSDQTTGVAYANPSTQSASITFNALGLDGIKLASKSLTLAAGAHDAANMGPFLVLNIFKGSIQVISTVPIISLSLNAEAFPSFSSLPAGELDDSTPLATGENSNPGPEPPPPDYSYGY
ncbi:MAG: hypothetical protein HY313_06125 [Acidobacteria bacterium]|nr:hypothetical protein [Acidobacteriota bacterium]